VTIVFDMDNTLVDSFGTMVRPGIIELLLKLRTDGYSLVLWTNSRRERALEILRSHDLRRHFKACIFREDYDPEEKDVPKDINSIKADTLVDDDPDAIRYAQSTGRKGFLLRPYRKGAPIDRTELAQLYSAIIRPRRFFLRMRR
jgi:FMN phosphatase YigB (HAD superfamily)